MLSGPQKGVLRGMMIGLAATLIVLGGAIVGHPSALMPAHSPIASALAWDALVAACLAINIGALARHRFFAPADIDGGGLSDGTKTAHLLQATIQNTLEQSVLAIATHLAWAATMPFSWQAAIPAAAMLFFVGRVLFWRGYAHGAAARAIGFALTFYPSIAMLAALAVHAAMSMLG